MEITTGYIPEPKQKPVESDKKVVKPEAEKPVEKKPKEKD